MSNSLTVHFGDPAALAIRIEVLQEVHRDPARKRLESIVPALLFGIDGCLSIDNPAHVAGPVWPQRVHGRRLRRMDQKPLYRLHRLDRLCPFRRRQWFEYRARLPVLRSIQDFECFPTLASQFDLSGSAVLLRGGAFDQAVDLELGQNPA